MDDYRIFQAITETQNQLDNINIIFLHVLGHQDQKHKK